jgi:hypothetical protein
MGFALDNGPSFPGTRSAHWVRSTTSGQGRHAYFLQSVSVLGEDAPRLSLDVKVTAHNLEAGGDVEPDPAFEWPVRVDVLYTLASDPSQTQGWVHGFYVSPPGDGDPFDEGSGIIAEYEDTEVQRGVWSTHAFDLANELPDLGEIIRVRIGGAGWAFEGQVDNVVLSRSCPCSGCDVDDDGFCNFFDSIAIAGCRDGDCSGCVNPCDVNCDGGVNNCDFLFVIDQINGDFTCKACGACCTESDCIVTSPEGCDFDDGVFVGDGTVCGPDTCQCLEDADCNDTHACTYDECTVASCFNSLRAYGDANGDGALNLFDIFCILDLIEGSQGDAECNVLNADISPCTPNGTLNLLDVFAVLDAIGGLDPCCGE